MRLERRLPGLAQDISPLCFKRSSSFFFAAASAASPSSNLMSIFAYISSTFAAKAFSSLVKAAGGSYLWQLSRNTCFDVLTLSALGCTVIASSKIFLLATMGSKF